MIVQPHFCGKVYRRHGPLSSMRLHPLAHMQTIDRTLDGHTGTYGRNVIKSLTSKWSLRPHQQGVRRQVREDSDDIVLTENCSLPLKRPA